MEEFFDSCRPEIVKAGDRDLIAVLLPKVDGKPMAAGPGVENSAAIGPLLFVGVQTNPAFF